MPATTLSDRQQLDALWSAICSGKYWVDGGASGTERFTISLSTLSTHEQIEDFHASTREEVIAQLIAHQVAERLDND
jgi:hypothetical protein